MAAKNLMIIKWVSSYEEKTPNWRKVYPWIAEEKNKTLLWNKLAKALHIHNPNITTVDFANHRDNHYGEFVNRILSQVKDDRISLADIGKIEALDNGTRGLASTMHMQLWNVDHTAILDVADCHTYKYYYM